MTQDIFPLLADESLADALKRINSEKKRFHGYPVMDEDEQLIGVITRHELSEHDPEMPVCHLLDGQQLLSVTSDTSIRDAANRMIARDFQQVPVVSAADPKKLLGWLTLNDIARQQNAVEG